MQPFDGGFVHLRDGVVGGHQAGVIARASGQHLAPKPRFFIDFEHVDAGVEHAAVEQHGDGFVPGGEGLAGQSGDQVQVEIGDSGGAQPLQVVKDDGPAV